MVTLSYATHTLHCKDLSNNHAFPQIYKALTLSVPDVARVQGGNQVRDAEVIKNLDSISTLLGTDLGPSTGTSGIHGLALETSLRSGRYTDDQGKPGDDVWGRL